MRSLPLPLLLVALVLAPNPAAAGKKEPKAPAEPIDGAAVYRESCGRCHSLRPTEELDPADWSVVATHMQVRAGLPRRDIDALLAWIAPAPGLPNVDPAEVARRTLPELPLVAERCVRCHGVDRILAASEADHDPDWWRGTLRRMGSYGAVISLDEEAALAAALAAHGASSAPDSPEKKP